MQSGHCEEADIESIFDKKFDFDIPSQGNPNLWTLSSFHEECANGSEFHSSQLAQLKHESNELKKSLNDFDITQWNKHTNKTNPASYVNSEVRNTFHPELCTQAWCKFHELLSFANVIPEHALSTRKLNAVHLCEAPGAFICSLNHFLRSHYPKVKYKWIGNTLNPYYEGNDPNSCIGDDRLIFQNVNSWCFGSDNTGDIFSKTTLDELEERASDLDIIHLVTADGSCNCQEKPENQERDTVCLKYAELHCALSLLSYGGSFVLKTFTMFEFPSVVVMYILCCTFTSVTVRKPATSKPGNSELYVVARNFRGKECCMEILSTLKKRFPFTHEQDLDLISASKIPHEFITQHEKCVSTFVTMQMETIKQNKKLYHGKNWFTPDFEEHKRRVCDTALELMKMRKIQRNQCVLQSGVLRGRVQSNVKLRPKLLGSFSQRHSTDVQTDEIHCMNKKIKRPKEENINEVHWKTSEVTPSPKSINFLYGKRLISIKLSLFCDTDLLMELHKNWQLSSDHKQQITKIDGSFFDSQISKSICQIASGMGGSVFELDFGASQRSYWTKILSDVTFGSLRHIAQVELDTPHCMVDCSLLLANLVREDYRHGCFRELETRESMLYVTVFVLKFLPGGGSFALMLPSVMTRFSAGLLWMLCQCFGEYTIIVDRSSTKPGMLLICKGKRNPGRWVELTEIAKQAMQETSDSKDLLQIIPLDVILQDTVFSSALRRCNHQVLNWRLSENQHNFIL